MITDRKHYNCGSSLIKATVLLLATGTAIYLLLESEDAAGLSQGVTLWDRPRALSTTDKAPLEVTSGTCADVGRAVLVDPTCGDTCQNAAGSSAHPCHREGARLGWDIGQTNQVYSDSEWPFWADRPPGCFYESSGGGHRIWQSPLTESSVACSDTYRCLCGAPL